MIQPFRVGQKLCFILNDRLMAGEVIENYVIGDDDERYITVGVLDGRHIGFSNNGLLSRIELASELLDEMVEL